MPMHTCVRYELNEFGIYRYDVSFNIVTI
jgi:hypothetical protein